MLGRPLAFSNATTVGADASSVDAKMCLAIVAIFGRSQWLRGLRRRSAAARLLRLWIRIPRGHGCFSFVSVVCGQVEVCAID